MTSTMKTQKLITEKLLSTNNDKHLVKLIMSYMMGDCDICHKKCLDADLTSVEICDIGSTIDLCEKCLETETCDCCDNFIGDYEYADIESDKYCCGDPSCDTGDKYCKECANENLYYCSNCEDLYCCRKIYNIEDNYLCEVCINENCVFNPRGNT